MPDISYEALAGAALVIVLAVGYQYLPKAEGGDGPRSGKAKKKNNKKKAKAGEESGSSTEAVKQGVEEVKKKAKEVVKKGKNAVAAAPAPAPQPTAPEPITPESSAPSFAEVAAEGVDEKESTPKPEMSKPKTLAQKIAPKNRKSKVDDMLAPEDRPTEHARVMKVVQPSSESDKQSEKVSKYEDDYQEGDDTTSGSGTIEDDGWDVVRSKKKKAFSISNSSSQSTTTHTSAPLPVDTKIQRKNAKKADDKKAIKDAEEADRLKRLAAHKKGLEKERISEIYKSGKKGSSGKTNGGAFASLDTNGKLVWD